MHFPLHRGRFQKLVTRKRDRKKERKKEGRKEEEEEEKIKRDSSRFRINSIGKSFENENQLTGASLQ